MALIGASWDELALGAAGILLVVLVTVLVVPLMYQDRPAPEPTGPVA